MNRRQHYILPILKISGTKFIVGVNKCQVSWNFAFWLFTYWKFCFGYRQIKFGRKSCSHIMLASTPHYLMAWDLLSCSGVNIKVLKLFFQWSCSHFLPCYFLAMRFTCNIFKLQFYGVQKLKFYPFFLTHAVM